jgi:hypothetical protein
MPEWSMVVTAQIAQELSARHCIHRLRQHHGKFERPVPGLYAAFDACIAGTSGA